MIKPRHIAVIMDGNGRWAKRYLLHRVAGHRAGATNLRRLVEQMNDEGYEILTVYAFSTENWKRTTEEVSQLMSLIHEYIQQYIDDSKKNNAQIKVIGDISALEPSLQQKISELERITARNKGLLLNIALNYGGRDELIRAVKKAYTAKGDNIKDLDEDMLSAFLDTCHMPDPDLLIRTGGETRLSNFLLWQLAYAELYFTETLWPDFKFKHLQEAVMEYNKRARRFGGR